MLATTLSIIFRIIAIVAVMLLAEPLTGYVEGYPAFAFRAICITLMLYVAFAGALRLINYRHLPLTPMRTEHAIGVARVAGVKIEDDYQLDRRARHEAAHAVVAFHFRRPQIRADVVRTHRVGGSVSCGGGNGPLANVVYEDMQIAFAGQVVDVDSGYYDGGAQNDMRRITDLAMMILSTSTRPVGFTGRVTMERLVSGARRETAAVLAQYEPAIERITAALVKKRILNTAELTALMGLPAAADPHLTDGAAA